jgi:uncharacterized protein YjbJ (UPF0337 family)
LGWVVGLSLASIARREPELEAYMADDLGEEGLKDQIKGTVKEGEGRLRNAVGGLRSDTSEQIKGKGQELKGKMQRKIGEAESDADRDI